MVFSKQKFIAICLLGFWIALFVCGKSLLQSATAQENPTLHGTVVGLAGSLLLELNGKEEIEISENKPFVFKTPLAPGQDYEVRIKKTAKNHRCEIIKGKGRKSLGEKATVEILCKETGRWTHPSSLTDTISPASNARMTAVAVNKKGSAIAAWSQHDGKSWRIFKSEYLGKKWSIPSSLADAISPAGGGDAMKPRVAISDNGDMVVVWEERYGKSSHIFMAEKRSGKWQLPSSIKDYVSYENFFAWEPDVAIDDVGNTIIVWSQETESGFHAIYKSEFRGGKWHHPSSLAESISSSIQDGDGLNPKVVMNNKGEALIVWEQDPDGISRIFLSEYANGSWRVPSDKNDHISPQVSKRNRAYRPFPAIDNNGRAVIAWQQAYESKTRIYKSEKNNGKWQHPNSLSEAISPEAVINAQIMGVVMDNTGNAVVLWSKKEKRKTWLIKSEKRNGKWISFSDEDYIVKPPKGGYKFRVLGKAALSVSGKAVIVSIQMGDDRISRLFLTEYDNNFWYVPGEKVSLAEMPVKSLEVAAAQNGMFVITWVQNDGTFDRVYTSLFRPAS